MSAYESPRILFNRHVETIFPSLFRRVHLPPYQRERIPTPDDDFLDLDWLKQGSQNLVILSHGLEGNTSRPYIKGMARAFYQNKYDVLAWNFRGCSEEMNRQLRFYHSGATDDLDTVISHARKNYTSVFLIGFSLGGNLTLKFMGEQGDRLPTVIKGAAAFSVPLDLHSSCIEISKKENWIYSQRFLRSLKEKIARKARINTGLKTNGLTEIATLIDFDDRFTSVLHGFSNALDYYAKCSSIHFLDKICAPTLLINAKNDPFLGNNCFPAVPAGNKHVTVEYPEGGGHVGFTLFNQNGLYWSELRALQFIDSIQK